MILHVRSDSIKCILVEAGHKRGTESWSSLYIIWYCILTFSSYFEVLHLVNKFSLLIAQAAPLTSVRTINKIKGRGGARRSRKKSRSIKTTWIGSMHQCCSGRCKYKLQCLLWWQGRCVHSRWGRSEAPQISYSGQTLGHYIPVRAFYKHKRRPWVIAWQIFLRLLITNTSNSTSVSFM